MKNWKKLAMTAGAVGALGVAGSFGTFSAFTDVHTAKTIAVTSGTLKVSDDFSNIDFTNLGTRDTLYNCNKDTGLPATPSAPDTGSECWAGNNDKHAGTITVTNTGSLPQDVYFDFDGPVQKDPSQDRSLNEFAENVIVDSSDTSAFLPNTGYTAYRIWKLNNSGPRKWISNLAPGASQTIHFRAYLREPVERNDNTLQNQSLAGEQVTVSGVEVGRTDIGPGNDLDGGV